MSKTSPETPASYLTIPEANFAKLEDKLAKLNKRAAKLGLAPITLAEISRDTRKKHVGRNTLDEPVYTEHVWLTLDVVGQKPTVPGWTLIGAIDHQDQTDGTINVLRAGRGETVPEDYRHAHPTCDHCETTRRRRDTFILRDARGTHKQIGRTCLQDFLGEGETAAQLVGWLKFEREIEKLCGDCEDEDAYSATRGDYGDTGRYLAAVAAAVRVDGWTSKGSAYENGGCATAETAWSVLYPSPIQTADASHPTITPDDHEIAEKALTWIRGLPEAERAEGYLANLYAACARDGFRTKQAGVVASLVGAAYPRALREDEAEARKQAETAARADQPRSEHVGEPRERLKNMAVTIEKIRGWEGRYGYTTLVVLRDAAHNLIVWYASGDVVDDLPAEGAKGTLTGTVKRHGTDKYTGESCTYVNRCKLIE